jgi:putative SOS response-associated peptidase YedK
MCGRFTLHAGAADVARVFGVDAPLFEPRYNIAPSEVIGVVRAAAPGRVFAAMRWGLVPHWSREKKAVPNARAETVATTPWFRDAFRQRRCLIPADGFYEWVGTKGKKQPYHFRLKGGDVFAFAGLWDRWQGLETSALITTDANAVVNPVHHRMPVILGADSYDIWLDEKANRAALQALLRPFPPELMEGFTVSPRVNKGGVEGADLVEPVATAVTVPAGPRPAHPDARAMRRTRGVVAQE